MRTIDVTTTISAPAATDAEHELRLGPLPDGTTALGRAEQSLAVR